MEDLHTARISRKRSADVEEFQSMSVAMFHMVDPPGLNDFQRFEAPCAPVSSIALLFGLACQSRDTLFLSGNTFIIIIIIIIIIVTLLVL